MSKRAPVSKSRGDYCELRAGLRTRPLSESYSRPRYMPVGACELVVLRYYVYLTLSTA